MTFPCSLIRPFPTAPAPELVYVGSTLLSIKLAFDLSSFCGTSMSVAEWDNEYARLARAASQLRTAGLASTRSEGDANSVFQGLSRLDSVLNSLPLQAGEIQRRHRLIQSLQGTVRASPALGVSGASNSGAAAGLIGPQSQMAIAMGHQDALIDELAIGVGRLKNQTVAIGEEARMHVNLLGDMEENLDAAQASLDAETRRAARVKEDQSLWRLQLIVAGLFILLVLLILMGLSP